MEALQDQIQSLQLENIETERRARANENAMRATATMIQAVQECQAAHVDQIRNVACQALLQAFDALSGAEAGGFQPQAGPPPRFDLEPPAEVPTWLMPGAQGGNANTFQAPAPRSAGSAAPAVALYPPPPQQSRSQMAAGKKKEPELELRGDKDTAQHLLPTLSTFDEEEAPPQQQDPANGGIQAVWARKVAPQQAPPQTQGGFPGLPASTFEKGGALQGGVYPTAGQPAIHVPPPPAQKQASPNKTLNPVAPELPLPAPKAAAEVIKEDRRQRGEKSKSKGGAKGEKGADEKGGQKGGQKGTTTAKDEKSKSKGGARGGKGADEKGTTAAKEVGKPGNTETQKVTAKPKPVPKQQVAAPELWAGIARPPPGSDITPSSAPPAAPASGGGGLFPPRPAPAQPAGETPGGKDKNDAEAVEPKHEKYENQYWVRDKQFRHLTQRELTALEGKKEADRQRKVVSQQGKMVLGAEVVAEALADEGDVLPDELLREHRMVREQLEKQKARSKGLKEEARFENETFLTVGKKKKPSKEAAPAGRGKGKGGSAAVNSRPKPRAINDERGNDLTRIVGGRRNDGWN